MMNVDVVKLFSLEAGMGKLAYFSKIADVVYNFMVQFMAAWTKARKAIGK